MASNVDISGSVMTVANPFNDVLTGTLLWNADPSALPSRNSIKYKNIAEKKRYNDWLIGDALRVDLGHETNNADGTLIDNPTSTPPSWTQHAAGKSHGHVIGVLSSSVYEIDNLNTWRSGSIVLESTAVSETGSEYYSKQTSLITKTYYLTASADLSGTSHIGAYEPVSGNTMFWDVNGAEGDPCRFVINVPDYGKLIDIKVWVEFLHLSGTLGSPVGLLGNLRNTFVGLRSPNVFFKDGRPLMNNETLAGQEDQQLGIEESLQSKDKYGNCFLLWDASWDPNLNVEPPGPLWYEYDPMCWDRDRHMRTVFWDGAKESTGNNPRQIGVCLTSTGFKRSNIGLNSPNGILGNGNNYPWLTDERAQRNGPYGAPGSPPVGWLTGPGGVTASYNEFPTTGSNLGPDYIRPVYPLASNIIEEGPWWNGSTNSILLGIRPGLRGTEIYGDWELLIGVCWRNNTNHPANYVLSGYFRQFRLEITYEKNIEPYNKRNNKSHSNIFYKKNEGKRFLYFMSSSFVNTNSQLFHEANTVYTLFEEVQQSPGLTIGITDSTASVDFAVFSRITGTLFDRLTGSTKKEWFLNNEFGTPWIPLTSGSGVDPSVYQIADVSNIKNIVSDTLNPKKDVNDSITLNKLLNRYETTKLTRDIIKDKIEDDEDNNS